MRKRGKILHSGAGHRWQHGACTLHAGYLRLQIHTIRLCNTHCFSTATMVARTRLIGMLYIHRLCVFNLCADTFLCTVVSPASLLSKLALPCSESISSFTIPSPLPPSSLHHQQQSSISGNDIYYCTSFCPLHTNFLFRIFWICAQSSIVSSDFLTTGFNPRSLVHTIMISAWQIVKLFKLRSLLLKASSSMFNLFNLPLKKWWEKYFSPLAQ